MKLWKEGIIPGRQAGGLLARLPGRRSKVEEIEEFSKELTAEGLLVTHLIHEGRFQRSLSLITAFSTLLGGAEVAYEHYRGSYSQKKMYSPVVISPLLIAAGIGGALNRRIARTALPALSIIMLGDGVLGFIFHVRGVARKPGNWRIPAMNVVMGPPVFAPLLLGICGYLGLIASFLRREDDPNTDLSAYLPKQGSGLLGLLPREVSLEALDLEQDIREGRFQQQVAMAAALSAVFSGAEAWYSHYKNNFQYKVQWTPIVLTPIIFAGGMGAVRSRKVARTLLPAASALALIDGGVGFFYHARGVLRRPGGMRMPLYNIMYGPPIFAPLLFAASGFMGLLASFLRRKR